ncbi:winged helix DNA-binding domain-containing protein [Streptomyces sp. NPDC091272]|uniref:winged helix DNA-binding domain-containing protein n=1 Tax=Streptomyces sp. NPDC091272 TaxID=3365981 RepID=UPI0038170A10
MEITARELNRATLARQLLLQREPLSVEEAVGQVVALQAQHAPSPYLALWNRISGFDPADLDEAFTRGSVVKATLLRLTLHAVRADDYPVFREAMRPTLRASRLGDRFAATGLTPADCDLLVPDLLSFADRPRTGAELEAWVGEQLGVELQAGAWWGLRACAPLVHVPSGGPWSFGARPSYVAAHPHPAPAPAPVGSRARQTEAAETAVAAQTQALQALVLRCLAGFGPVTVADIAQFTQAGRTAVRKALESLGDAVERLEGPAGAALFDLPGAPRPAQDTPAPARLMAMWDSSLLAYADRSRIIPSEYRRLVIRNNGDVLPTLLVDGYVAGLWRPVDGGIEATAFHRLTREQWEQLADEASSLTALLADREPRVYSRYGHWWAKSPDPHTTRLLPG